MPAATGSRHAPLLPVTCHTHAHTFGGGDLCDVSPRMIINPVFFFMSDSAELRWLHHCNIQDHTAPKKKTWGSNSLRAVIDLPRGGSESRSLLGSGLFLFIKVFVHYRHDKWRFSRPISRFSHTRNVHMIVQIIIIIFFNEMGLWHKDSWLNRP